MCVFSDRNGSASRDWGDHVKCFELFHEPNTKYCCLNAIPNAFLATCTVSDTLCVFSDRNGAASSDWDDHVECFECFP